MEPNIAVQYSRPYFSCLNVQEKIAVWLCEIGGLANVFHCSCHFEISCTSYCQHPMWHYTELISMVLLLTVVKGLEILGITFSQL